jgi:hypothetical protein
MIAPIASSVRSRLVTDRYLLASPPARAMAMVMLTPTPSAARANPPRTICFCAPEASMAITRLAARVAVVASHAQGSLGADIEKNTVMMSRARTTPN